MKRLLNNNKMWNKYWDNKGNFRMFDLATIKKITFISMEEMMM